MKTQAADLLNLIAAELNTEDKNACISVAIKMLVDSGLAVNEAFDALFGEGAYLKMAGNIYHSLRNECA